MFFDFHQISWLSLMFIKFHGFHECSWMFIDSGRVGWRAAVVQLYMFPTLTPNKLTCTDKGVRVQNIVAHQNTASVSISFTITFPIITRMKFGMTLQHVVSTR